MTMRKQTERRTREIRRRARCKRQRRERCARSGLTLLSLLLLAGLGALLHGVQAPGVSAVAGGCGAVLLRDGTGAYILVALAAFLAGAALTILCFRCRKTSSRIDRAEEREETL